MRTKIILRKDVPNLGMAGDITEVRPGYARNFLFPKKLAQPATPSNLKTLEHERAKYEKEREKKKVLAQEVAEKIKGVECVIKAKVGRTKKLFGSITASDILEALSKQGVKIERYCLKLSETIKTLGDFHVEVKLHPDVKTSLKVKVISAGEEEEESAEAAPKEQEGEKEQEMESGDTQEK